MLWLRRPYSPVYQVKTGFLGESSSECYTDVGDEAKGVVAAGRSSPGELLRGRWWGRWEGRQPAPDPAYRLSTADRLRFVVYFGPGLPGRCTCIRCQHFQHDNGFIRVSVLNSHRSIFKKAFSIPRVRITRLCEGRAPISVPGAPRTFDISITQGNVIRKALREAFRIVENV